MAGGKRKVVTVHRPGQMYKKPRYTENPRERLEESERSSPANYSGATSSRAIEEDNTSFNVPRKQSKRGRNRAKKRWNPANRSNKSIPALSKEISASFTRIKASVVSTLDRMAPPSHCKVEPIATQQLTGPCYPGQKNDVISHRDDVMPRPRDTLSTHSGGFGGAYSQKYGHCDHRASTTITTLAPPLSWSKEIHTREVKREYDSELSFVPQHTRCPFTIQPSTDRTVVPSGNWSSTDRAAQSSTFETAQQPSSSQCFTGDFPTQQSDPPGSCPLLPPTPVPRRNQTSHSPPVQIRNQTPHSAPVPRQNQTYHSPPVPRQNQSFHSPPVPRRNQTYHSTPVPRQNQSFHSPPVPRQNQTYHSTPVPRQNQSFDSPPVPRRNRNGREVVALDCEMVGCRPDDLLSHALEFQRLGKRKKKKPPKEVSVAGRCSIVDYHGNVLYDSYIRPNRPITSLRTFCSGITASHMHRATPIDHARLKIVEILREKVVVAHHIKNDLDALSISLPPELVRDTSSFPPLQVCVHACIYIEHMLT